MRLNGIYNPGDRFIPGVTSFVEFIEIKKVNKDGSLNVQSFDYKGRKYGRSFRMESSDIECLKPYEV